MTVRRSGWWGGGRRARLAAVVGVLGGAIMVPPVVAQPGYTVIQAMPVHRAQQPVVILTVRDSTAEFVINEIARQAGMRVAYGSRSNAILVRTTRVSVRLDRVPVAAALAAVVRGTELAAQIAPDGETIMVRARGATPDERGRQGGGTIAGRVADSTTGMALDGAQVRLEGMPKISAVTSDSGRFTLRNVPAGDQVLQVRLFGYRPATRTVTVVDGERTTVRIALASAPTVLSGVVTTATGAQRKVEVGNDITTINVDSVMRVAPISTVTDLLETRVPGLTVQHTSGVPGNPSRIRVRGAGSIIGNNDPIVIVDGIRVYASQSDPRNANLAPSQTGGGDNPRTVGSVTTSGYAAPSPLDQIDPNSIETIEVFKGPSASALYGSDAAAGVIVVTTKHGRAGPTHWALDLSQGVNWLPGSWPTNYYKFGKDTVTYASETNWDLSSHPCSWDNPRCGLDSLVAFQALNDPRYSVFSRGHDQKATLTISGGVPTLQYSVSGSAASSLGNLKLPAMEQQRYEHFYGPIPSYLVRPDRYTTWGVDGSLTAQPTSTMRVMLRSSLFNGSQQQGSLQQAISQLAGEYISGGVAGWSADLLGLGRSNPIDTLTFTPLIQNDVEQATDEQLTSTNALTLTWQPYSWLPLTAAGGLNTIQRTDRAYIPYGVNYAGPGTVNSADTSGFYGSGHGTSHNQTFTVGTAIPLLRERLTLGMGGNVYAVSTSDYQTSTNRLAPGVSTPTSFLTCTGTDSLVCTPSANSQAITGQSTYGWYMEPRLNFHSRFFVAPGFRLDGGSASGSHGGFSGTGLTGFPKLDFSWIAVDQSQPRGPLSLLRPRLAFGLAGTQPAPQAKLRLFVDSASILNGSTVVPSVALSSLGNTGLRPETSRELEGGVDAEFWHGRLGMTWTQYTKTRSNALLNIPVAPSVFGRFVTYQVNIGVVRNTGHELTLQAQPLESRVVSWTVGANISNDNNTVIRLAPGVQPNKQLGIVAGYPLFGMWAKPIVAFSDLDGNGIITVSPTQLGGLILQGKEVVVGDSLRYIGVPNPKYQANINTGIALFNGRLGLHAMFAYQNGMTQNNQAAINSRALDFIANAPGATLATKAAIAAAEGGLTDIGFFQTVNTFRFNELSANYVLPQTIAVRWLHVPRATLALQGKNLGLHSNYRGIDPNVNAFSTVSTGDETADLGQIPEPRTWWLTLSLGH